MQMAWARCAGAWTRHGAVSRTNQTGPPGMVRVGHSAVGIDRLPSFRDVRHAIGRAGGTHMVTPGDVLLTHGPSAVSWAIRFLDQSPVNHAAIALDDTTEAEALWQGLERSRLANLVERNKYVGSCVGPRSATRRRS